MGLLTEKVEVSLSTSNVNHYKKLGYEIPTPMVQGKSKITINVNELTNGSHVEVDVRCDNCQKTYTMMYKTYLRFVNEDNTIYCCDCVHSIKNSRENNPNWKSDKTDDERIKDRSTNEYREWSKRVLARDNYTCQYCGESKSRHMNAHHLDGYNWCVEKRFDVTNGICLCEDCHENFHSIYGKGYNTREQVEEWFGNKEINLQLYNGEIPRARRIYNYEKNIIYDNAMEYATKDLQTSFGNIYNCCNTNSLLKKTTNPVHTCKKCHLFWYDEFINMAQEQIDYFVNNCITKERMEL